LFFLKGKLENRVSSLLGSFALVLIASTFHAGTIVILAGYGVGMILLQVQGDDIRIGLNGLLPTLSMALLFIPAIALAPDLILGKFADFDSPESIFQDVNHRRGGSAYLTSLEVTSLGSLLLYAPVRAVYFIASPMPWDWRGVGDILAF